MKHWNTHRRFPGEGKGAQKTSSDRLPPRGHYLLFRFEIEIADNAREAEVDPKMFFELLFLLLENACVYSSVSSPVEIDLRRENGVIQVSVLDRGPGIPEADRERVFD